MTDGLPFSMLVVDDDADDRIFLDDAFLQLGYDAEVKKFKDVPGLFHYLESIDATLLPSLIVLENRIAEVDAPLVIQSLKRDEHYQTIAVAVCSSMLSPQKQKELLTMGVDAFFEKGDNMEETLQLAKDLKEFAERKSARPKV